MNRYFKKDIQRASKHMKRCSTSIKKCKLKLHWGLPWGSSGKESTCQCRGEVFDPLSGKITHASEQLISPRAKITGAPETQLLSPHAQSSCSSMREATATRSPCKAEWPLLIAMKTWCSNPPPKKPHWDTICWLKKTKNQKNTQSKSWNLCFIQRPYWGLQPGMAVSQIALRDYSEDVKKGTGIHRNFCWEKNNMRLHINRLLLIKKQIISS